MGFADAEEATPSTPKVKIIAVRMAFITHLLFSFPHAKCGHGHYLWSNAEKISTPQAGLISVERGASYCEQAVKPVILGRIWAATRVKRTDSEKHTSGYLITSCDCF